MTYLKPAHDVAWGLCLAALLLLITGLFRSGNYRQVPYFTAYTIGNIAQSGVLVILLWYWGSWTPLAREIGWFAIGLTLLARTLAVAELCRRVLRLYGGIWGLAWRLFALGAAGIGTYSYLAADRRWTNGLIAADRAMALALAGVVVLLFVFCRYYEVQISKPDRFLGIGFFLYSASVATSHSLLERFFRPYTPFWDVGLLVSFFVALTLWIQVLWSPVPKMNAQPAMMEGEFYKTLSPEINLRLRTLDQQLSTLWRTEAREP